MPQHTNAFFDAAADAAETGMPAATADAAGLLGALGYDLPAAPTIRQQHAALLRAAGKLVRLLQLRAPDAPGLEFLGAEVDPGVMGGTGLRRFSASGVGLSFRAAFEGCVGEAVEMLSQVEGAGDALDRASLAAVAGTIDPATAALVARLLDAAGLPADSAIDWAPVTRLADAAPALLPADLILRRDPARRVLTPPAPLSLGCGAGPNVEVALLHGLLETIERDAVALWWQGGRRGHALPLPDAAHGDVAALLTTIRGDRTTRPTWLLDITTDLAIPCVAAVSSAADGSAMACGTAARPSLAEAACSAIMEMCQMELAHHVVDAKRAEQGLAGLNAADHAHLRRRHELDARHCVLLHPLPPAAAHPLVGDRPDPAANLPAIISHLAARGIAVYARMLTRPALGVPAAVVHCPALEQWPSAHPGARLRATIARTGGGDLYTNGVPIM